MIYRDFQGIKLSGLGMGNMRLPVVDGNDSKVDLAEAEKIIDYAYEHGVNYFDTAYGYHGGTSEAAVRNALSKYPRESYYLADKFPGYDLSNMPKVKEIFEEQLERCGVDYFDFYLFHNVCELNIEQYLDPQYGIFDYLMEQKRNGLIKHLGFSCHGAMPVLRRFLDAYGEHMEFCQIQLNYVDWSLQHADEKVALLNERNIPVWVMEGVRGGRLVSLPEDAASKLRALRPDESVVSWAFRFLQSVKGVTMVLSGMSTMDQVKDNVAIWSEDKPLNEEEFKAITDVGRALFANGALPCTACHYCVSHCPMGLDIPHLITLYNEFSYSGKGFITSMNLQVLPEDKRPSACIGCHSCTAVCPQQLPIPETFAKFTEMLSAGK
ncbi:MAG TPA: aldo/keto reductase [Candidatus Scatomorpha intestinavium]|uniref:Aldo/keto reductase n=1 Tax=Candidatus Scatomorpha intestinavium TaxID=2840922 RepID=A0A9D1CU93_9FIRM|nr:aldo/keto reductase [Candidatus Scatomorpha intestinavium]